jgi:circadian clock protein KaiC
MTRVSTGIQGLDNILNGGFIRARAYVVRGGPGVGKTIAGMHFIHAGLRAGESVLFIGLNQPVAHILEESETLGLPLRKAAFLDLTPSTETFTEMHTYDIFSPAEVERDPITRMIAEKIMEVQPQRIFIDGFSQFRHLAGDAFHLRRLVQSFFTYATQLGATVLVSCDQPDNSQDCDFQFVADGVITLQSSETVRTVQISKFRRSAFHQGSHVMQLTGEGIIVAPTAA